jgi:endonuclease YncB( thermonuclease family)
VPAPKPSYSYHATVLAVHDGDTITARVDRGQITHGILDDPTWTIRLYGIDTWEITGKDKAKGQAARDFTATVLRAAHKVTVQTIHPDLRPPELEKYGRLLCWVWADDELLADLLRANGHEKVIGPIV